MKFIKKFIKLFLEKLIKEKNGKILFSYDTVEIFEEENLFQTIDGRDVIPSKELEIYVKKLKKFSKIDIYIGDGYFKTAEIEIAKDEVSEEDIGQYIEYEMKELLNQEDVDEYFFKYFKNKDETADGSLNENYIVYILKREFVEDLVEFALKNRLKIGKIILGEEGETEFFIDDYDLLLHKNSSFSVDRKGTAVICIMLSIFAVIKICNISQEKKILNFEKKLAVVEKNLNETKDIVEQYEEEIFKIKEEIKKFDIEKEYIQEKILRILKIMPENISIENIYYENGFLNIGGYSASEISLFVFLEILEKNKKVLSVKYDYIIKKDESYEFFLEIKV